MINVMMNDDLYKCKEERIERVVGFLCLDNKHTHHVQISLDMALGDTAEAIFALVKLKGLCHLDNPVK